MSVRRRFLCDKGLYLPKTNQPWEAKKVELFMLCMLVTLKRKICEDECYCGRSDVHVLGGDK
jgi:hypothetical protein